MKVPSLLVGVVIAALLMSGGSAHLVRAQGGVVTFYVATDGNDT